MIAQTYCGISYHDTRGEVRDCDAADGPCPSCLREHIAKLEEALDAATEEILLSRQSEGETMRDLLETREKLATAEASCSTMERQLSEARAAKGVTP